MTEMKPDKFIQDISEKTIRILLDSRELLGDGYEQTVLEMAEVMLPKEIVDEYENSWISVMDYVEEDCSAKGRVVVEIPDNLKNVFVLTKEDIGDDEFAYVLWLKP